jgi:Uma2 family endonuclease
MSAYAKQIDDPMQIDVFVDWMKSWSPEEKYELLKGEPVAMAGGTIDNEVIAGNIFAALFPKLRERGCRPLRDLLLRSQVSDSFGVFPDVYVRCGPSPDGQKTWVDDAVAVFEVLSPSTMAIDRGYKQQEYLKMPTLQHYILIYPRELRIECWSRDAGGGWGGFPKVTRTMDGIVDLPGLGIGLGMAEVYEGTEMG